jgi:hypothetical protein
MMMIYLAQPYYFTMSLIPLLLLYYIYACIYDKLRDACVGVNG